MLYSTTQNLPKDVTFGPVSYTHLDVYKRQGYTFVNLMPNTKPVCSSAAQAFMVEQKAAEVGLCDVNQTVSITENFRCV